MSMSMPKSKPVMREGSKSAGMVRLARTGAVAVALQLPALAWAADEVPPPPASPPPAVTPAPAPVETAAPAATVSSSSVAEEANSAKYKSISNAIWMRVGNSVRDKMGPGGDESDISLDAEVNAIFSGRVHKYMGWQANFVGTIDSGGSRTASILDLHAKIELHDAFNIWVGRMLVPSDRSNFSGPWFSSTWTYPGVFGGDFVGPKTGPFGRDNGATLWGQFMGGHLKYYAGAFNMEDANKSPLYSGRVAFSFLNPEPGYYHSSTYYGGKDIVAIGIGGQSQKDGVTTKDMAGMDIPAGDLRTFNADILAEKTIAGVGTFTFEGAYFKFNDKQAWDSHWLGLVSYLTPKPVWVGYVQPLVRVQGAKPTDSAVDSSTLVDAQLGYVLDQYAARLALGYQRRDLAGTASNAFILGVQIQK